MEQRRPHRYDTEDDFANSRPVHVVWEITLACNLKCGHCGSRAGRRRPDELTTEECFEVIRQLARLGTREITLIGGEAYMRRDWIELIRAISDHGIHCSMQSGGLALTEDKVRRAAAAGLRSAGVSLDGLPDVHDRLRGVAGSYARALQALGHLRDHGIAYSVNTQITALVIPQLRPLMQAIAATGAPNWQVQLTVAMGNAADHPELLLQPYQLLEVMPLLAELYDEALDLGMLMQPGNNIGYFGPYEHRWRVTEEKRHWDGCAAGHTGLGIEADGTIKGCPSLATGPYAGGNVRDMTIEEIWNTTDQLRFARDRTTEELWGFCSTCYYADVCRGGCTWMSHSLFDRAGNNPYCHYRVLQLAEAGLRERVEQVAAAPGRPFDNGRFDLILEPLDGGPGERIVPPPMPAAARKRTEQDRVPPALPLCRGCNQYVKPEEQECPHCGCDVAATRAAAAELERLLASAGGLKPALR
ncbi:MAG TPA: GDL motif peptide-associated radical SAM/SPASM maturase [Thermoanaerobaculia bacterium]|nr:GDL motif peptide-associated radical SAM/SPASM maturase [Thermoanaerobaculia bacterium]